MKTLFVTRDGDAERPGDEVLRDLLPDAHGVVVSDEGAASVARIVETWREGAFDLVVGWRTEEMLARLLPLGLSNAVLVPADVSAHPPGFWRQFIPYGRFVTFARSAHEALLAAGCSSATFAWWPAPSPVDQSATADAEAAELRPATGALAPQLRQALGLCRQLGVTRLVVRRRTDERASEPAPLSPPRADGIAVEVEGAASDRPAPLVAICPGRGPDAFACAAAMAEGRLAVGEGEAAREVLTHRTSGILMDEPADEASWDPATLRTIARAGRLKAEFGHRAFAEDRERLASILAHDNRRWGAPDASAAFVNDLRRAVRARRNAAGV